MNIYAQLPSKISPFAGDAEQRLPSIEAATLKAEMPVKVDSAPSSIVAPPAKPHQMHMAPADSQVPECKAELSSHGSWGGAVHAA
jgi:hypothetical protein